MYWKCHPPHISSCFFRLPWFQAICGKYDEAWGKSPLLLPRLERIPGEFVTETHPSTKGSFHLEPFNHVHQSVYLKIPMESAFTLEMKLMLGHLRACHWLLRSSWRIIKCMFLTTKHHLQCYSLILRNQVEWEMPRGYTSVTCMGIFTRKGNQINLLLHCWRKLEVRIFLFGGFSSSDQERAFQQPKHTQNAGYWYRL